MRQNVIRSSSPLFVVSIAGALALLTIALSYLPFSADAWHTFATVFLGIIIEATPFLILGTLASGLVEVYLDQEIIQKIVPRSSIINALIGSLLGLLFPVCECGVVPLVRRLLRKGLPIPTGIAFLLAAPVINPIVIFSTAAAFGFGTILWMRIGFVFLIATITGLVFSVVKTPWEILLPTPWILAESADVEHHDGCECCDLHDHPNKGKKLAQVFQITLDEFFEVGRFLVLGGLISAGMQTFIPQAALLNVGKGPIVSVLVMMGLAVLLSICSTVDSFVALGFVGIFNTGAILGFLLYGPMVDIKSTLMFLRLLRPRAVAYMVIIPFLLVLLICVSLNYWMVW